MGYYEIRERAANDLQRAYDAQYYRTQLELDRLEAQTIAKYGLSRKIVHEMITAALEAGLVTIAKPEQTNEKHHQKKDNIPTGKDTIMALPPEEQSTIKAILEAKVTPKAREQGMKYQILKCHRCGEIIHYAKYIRTTCTACGKKLNPGKSIVLAGYDKPAEAVYVEQRVKEELAREKTEFEKGGNYINRRMKP